MVTGSLLRLASSAHSAPDRARAATRLSPVSVVFISKPPCVTDLGTRARQGPARRSGNTSLIEPAGSSIEPGHVLVHLLLPVRPVVAAVGPPIVQVVLDALRFQELG